MHTLREVRIQNYKSIIDLTLPLTNYTPLVGQNNAGKSNILEAIKWFLQPSGLDIEAFNDPDEKIYVTGKIEGINEELFDELKEKHQKQIDKYIVDGEVTFRRIQLKPSGRKGDRKLEVRDPEKNEDDPEAFRDAPTGLPEALDKLFPDCIFIEAMDDAPKDITKNQRSTTIGQLISSLSNSIEKNNKEILEDSLGKLEEIFSAESENRAEQLNDFDEKAKEVIEDFFPGIQLKLHIPPPSIDDILKNGTVQVQEGEEELRDFESLGHGAQRSIQMALIRLLREFKTEEDTGVRKFLLIEEPELYLHPSAIYNLRNALRELAGSKFQVFFATHSPIVISRDDISNTILIRKHSSKGTYKLGSMRELVDKEITENDKQAEVLFNLTNSSKILFSGTVLLMEGKAEKNIIPDVFEKVSGDLRKEKQIAFIPMNGGGGIPKAKKILKAMDLKTLSLVDLDFCFREVIKKGIIDEDDEDIAKCTEIIKELSEEKGIAIDSNGFPTKNDHFEASEAYVELAKEENLQLHLKKIQEKLAAQGYWMWRKGDIEETFGIETKGHYQQLMKDLNKTDDWRSVLKEAEEIEDFVNWIIEY